LIVDRETPRLGSRFIDRQSADPLDAIERDEC
jgi:hypothetical protein